MDHRNASARPWGRALAASLTAAALTAVAWSPVAAQPKKPAAKPAAPAAQPAQPAPQTPPGQGQAARRAR